MKGLSRDLLAEVRRLANKKEKQITDTELFHSRNYREYLENMIASLTGRYVKPISLRLFDDDSPSASLAFTKGDDVNLNLSNSFAARFDSILVKFMTNLGLVSHEVGHILFMDFEGVSKGMKTISEGKFFGLKPKAKTKEEKENLEEIISYMGNPDFQPFFANLYHEFINCVQDGHDENCMKRRFGSLIRNAIDTMNTAMRFETPPLEQELKNAEGRELQVLFFCIIQIAIFGEVFMNDSNTKNCEFMQTVYRMAPDLYVARETDSTKERFSRINQLVLNLWPYIKKELEKTPDNNQGSGNSGSNNSSGSGNSDPSGSSSGNGGSNGPQSQQGGGSPSTGSQTPSQQQIAAVMNALANAASSAGASSIPMPDGRKTSDLAKDLIKNASVKSGNGKSGNPSPAPSAAASQSAGDDDPGQRALKQLLHALATEQAEDEIEKSLASEIMVHISTMDISETHRGVPVQVSRTLEVTQKDQDLYDTFMKELRPYSNRLQRGMKNILRDLKAGYTQHRRLFGNKLEADKTYRMDQRFYANKKAPMDIPDMAIACLVDESRSMHGPRHRAAMKATMLLHDFCLGLDIPVHVAGHKTNHQYVCYDVLTDFDTPSKKDCYRLAKLKADGSGNRDGLAIEIAGSRLEKRPEMIKLLFIISDGQPNHTGYRGSKAREDISGIVKKYRRKGIEVIATAIGDDKTVIREIYGNSFLDITDLSTLPKSLISLVKKRIIPK